MKKRYSGFVEHENTEGSNKAKSYVRALDLLGPILAKNSSEYSQTQNIWTVTTIEQIKKLYGYILKQQKLGDAGIFDSQYLPSYWRNGFYSAALNSYKQFLVLKEHENRLWEIVNTSDIAPVEISRQLDQQRITAIEELVLEEEINFSNKSGKEVLRKVKSRVNQSFFRKMVLSSYNHQCCVSGLNISSVLRASHITAWATDKENRLNPANGLCLSATYDAAFDRHLISFDEDYRMIFSPLLKEHCSNQAFQIQFQTYLGKRMLLPKRFIPDQELLNSHRIKTIAS